MDALTLEALLRGVPRSDVVEERMRELEAIVRQLIETAIVVDTACECFFCGRAVSYFDDRENYQRLIKLHLSDGIPVADFPHDPNCLILAAWKLLK